MALDDAGHPDAERLAEYADGVLEVEARADIERHLADCAECRAIVAETMAFLQANPATSASALSPRVIPFRSRRRVTGVVAGLAAAAALVLAVRVVQPEWANGLFGARGDRPDLQELIAALAKEPTRPVAGRLTGGFKYSPPPSPTRGPGDRELSPDVRIAAAKIEKLAREKDTPDGQAAMGVAYLAQGNWDRAIEALRNASEQGADSPHVLCDLAAAYLARNTPADTAKALDAAQRASADASAPAECWFNLALAWERFARPVEARSAWERYLALDNGSPWADEARQHLSKLVSKATPLASHERTSTQQDRRRLEERVLPAWGRAVLSGDEQEADRQEATALAIATFLADTDGDRLPLETVRALRRAHDRASRQRLAEGHVLFSDALGLQRQDQVSAAAATFRRACDAFAPASPFADWVAVQWLFAARDTPDADLRLDDIARRGADRGFHNLVGRALWVRGLRRGLRGEFLESISDYRAAATRFAMTGESEWLAAVSGLIAEAYELMGDYTTAWDYRQRSFATLSDPMDSGFRYGALAAATRAAIRQHLDGAAVAFQDSVIRVGDQWSTTITRAQSLVGRAQVRSRLGKVDAALNDYDAARSILRDVDDVRARGPVESDISLGRGELLPFGPARLAALDDALAQATAGQLEYKFSRIHFSRGTTLAAIGRSGDARFEFATARQLAEAQRARMSDEQLRRTSLDELWRIFVASIRVETSSLDAASAFRLSEEGRAAAQPARADAVATIRDVQARLDSGTALLSYVVLENQTLLWVITADRDSLLQLDSAERRLRELATTVTFNILDGTDKWVERSRDLYDALLRPALPLIVGKTSLVIVPDGAIGQIPFAALIDRRTGRLLVEDFSTSLAPSATVWTAAVSRLAALAVEPVRRVVAIGDPAFDRSLFPGLVPLPGALDEAFGVGKLYPGATVLTGEEATVQRATRLMVDADVVHFAGHAVVNELLPLMSRLLFAPDRQAETAGVLFGYDVMRISWLRTRLVILSACATGAGRSYRGEGLIGLALPFFNAGVPTVVATLWAVDDRVTVPLMLAFHRELRNGRTAAGALRAAQLARLATHPAEKTRPAGWASIVAIGGDLAGDRGHRPRGAN